jgi:hypothetical protein
MSKFRFYITIVALSITTLCINNLQASKNAGTSTTYTYSGDYMQTGSDDYVATYSDDYVHTYSQAQDNVQTPTESHRRHSRASRKNTTSTRP